ncbi:hypothetical protein QVD99_004267 [Batrachochytrium dendrobatidis]|nr:hypothetical protein QVD99_004265 [Batrachochytrium dendrobatidis]KAK5669893.1 hypothetical protein QVD99_004267 [Batrachochytrium dendrobatidis]
MVAFTLTHEHGYVLGVAVTSALFVTSLGIRVGAARRAAKVPYPYMYAEVAAAEKDPAKYKFNCAQRAHQNTLEGYPVFLMLLGISAIEHPMYAVASGIVWIVGKHLYAQGYCTGDPDKRVRGAFSYLGLLTLLGISIKTAITLAMSA